MYLIGRERRKILKSKGTERTLGRAGEGKDEGVRVNIYGSGETCLVPTGI